MITTIIQLTQIHSLYYIIVIIKRIDYILGYQLQGILSSILASSPLTICSRMVIHVVKVVVLILFNQEVLYRSM